MVGDTVNLRTRLVFVEQLRSELLSKLDDADESKSPAIRRQLVEYDAEKADLHRRIGGENP
jgi:hypothetical protein